MIDQRDTYALAGYLEQAQERLFSGEVLREGEMTDELVQALGSLQSMLYLYIMENMTMEQRTKMYWIENDTTRKLRERRARD